MLQVWTCGLDFKILVMGLIREAGELILGLGELIRGVSQVAKHRWRLPIKSALHLKLAMKRSSSLLTTSPMATRARKRSLKVIHAFDRHVLVKGGTEGVGRLRGVAEHVCMVQLLDGQWWRTVLLATTLPCLLSGKLAAAKRIQCLAPCPRLMQTRSTSRCVFSKSFA